jgi:DNA-binding MarR family transcriptional regulator
MPASTKDLLARDTFLCLVRAHEKLTAEFAELFKARGLTLAQYNVLRILLGGPAEGASCQYVGERLLNRVPDVTRLLDRMQAAGLVRRARAEDDRRVVRVRITPKGRKLCESLAEPVLDLHRRQLAALSASELVALHDGLERVLAS